MKYFMRTNKGFSLIEVMTVIAVIGIVVGLLYGYSDQGWRLFYQSYGRGLSQIKAKLAVKVISDELREANRKRITIGKGTTYGVPLPDDTKDNSPYIYFTKPKVYKQTGDVIGYDYLLFYFAKPKVKITELYVQNKLNDTDTFSILKLVKFIGQSKIYTEDEEKSWPFLPPILEINKSTLHEDNFFIESLKSQAPPDKEDNELKSFDTSGNEETIFLDHFSRIKNASRKIPISGNFLASSLTEPFTKDNVNIYFIQGTERDNPIVIKVNIQESPFLFGLKGAMTDFEVKITPRN